MEKREDALPNQDAKSDTTRVISLIIIIYERPVQGSPTAGLDFNAVE